MTSSSQTVLSEKSLNAAIMRAILGGVAAIVFLLVGFGLWASVVRISGAVIGSGIVVVESDVKKVQHQTGGIVAEILVENGDYVLAGQPLIRLDETVVSANAKMISNQIDELEARSSRLQAERDNAAELSFPKDLLRRRDDADVNQILRGETALFHTRYELRNGQKKQLAERTRQLTDETLGLEEQIKAKKREIELIIDELKGVEKLENQQLVTVNRINSLRREEARLEGELGALVSRLAQTKGKITEVQLQILSIDQEFSKELNLELRDVEAKQRELIEKRIAAEDLLKRSNILAPQTGMVHQLSVHTVGGVINPSEIISLIVPESDKMVIRARISPNDIDQVVSSNREAFIRFSSFDHQTTPELVGVVQTISADLTKDERTGDGYYEAWLEIPEGEKLKLNGKSLKPGMPADVYFKTQDRTVLSYLLKPVADQVHRAFRER